MEKHLIKERANLIYSLYPPKCVVKGSSTGKSKVNKDKIEKILTKGEYTFGELVKSISNYVSDCKKNDVFMKNFSTFLNNIPDVEEQSAEKVKMMVTFKTDATGVMKLPEDVYEREAAKLTSKGYIVTKISTKPA